MKTRTIKTIRAFSRNFNEKKFIAMRIIKAPFIIFFDPELC
jgi:hypothetical protein